LILDILNQDSILLAVIGNFPALNLIS